MKRFELSDGKSHKFWQIRVDGSTYEVRYGAIGSAGRVQEKNFDTPDAAAKAAEKVIGQKVKKGYVQVRSVDDPGQTDDGQTPKTTGATPTKTEPGMQGYLTRVEAVVAELRNDDRLTVTECKIEKPASKMDIEEARKLFGHELPHGLEAFYLEMNGFHLEWESEEEDWVTGQIRLLPITEVFGDWKEQIWFEEGDEFSQVKPFDFFVPEACAAFHPDAQGSWSVHFHYCGEELEPMGIDFPKYVDLLLAARGYFYWQKSLCTDASDSTEVEEFLEEAPKYFSDFSEDLFQVDAAESSASLDLIKAADKGSLPALKKALAAGGDPNFCDKEGRHPLDIVITYYRNEKKGLGMTTALLKAGADVNAPDENGYTPLFAASGGAYDGVIKALLAAGVEVDTVCDNRTALWQSIFWEQEAIALQLLAAGANPDLGADGDGNGVQDLAQTWGNQPVLAKLAGD